MRKWRSDIVIALVATMLGLVFSTKLIAASTRGGNGGDVMALILTKAKAILFEGSARADALPNAKEIFTAYCHQADPSLNKDQIEECADFVVTVTQELMKTRTDARLIAVAPSGELRIDEKNLKGRCFPAEEINSSSPPCMKPSARTEATSTGIIFFSYDFLTSEQASWANILAVLFHEYGHKIPFAVAGGSSKLLEDRDSTGAFSYAWQLLDVAGLAFTSYVQNEVKPAFFAYPAIIDRFRCLEYKNYSNEPDLSSIYKSYSSQREFLGKGKDKFNTYRSVTCRDLNCPFINSSKSHEALLPRLVIEEKNDQDCKNPASVESYFNFVAINKDSTLARRSDGSLALITPDRVSLNFLMNGTIYNSRDIDHYFANPICNPNSAPNTAEDGLHVIAEYEDLKLECWYERTIACSGNKNGLNQPSTCDDL